jgi:hypothetical protein
LESFYLPDRRDEFIRDRRSGHGIGRIEKVQSCAVSQFGFLVAVKARSGNVKITIGIEPPFARRDDDADRIVALSPL